LVAEKWNTSPGDIHLQWGQPRNPESLELVTGVELLGSGRNGRWIALLSVPGMEGDKVSVPLKTGVTMVQPYSKVPLVRGEVLEPANMEFQTGVHWGPASELPEAAEPGWVAQRRIEAGERLLPPGLRPPDLVISGRLVELVYTSGSLTISLQGKAVGSAALGEQVYVRTNEGHRMAGIVTAPGTVLLSNPGTGGVR
jgi:flagella basal body P-ring formation protein FlgA